MKASAEFTAAMETIKTYGKHYGPAPKWQFLKPHRYRHLINALMNVPAECQDDPEAWYRYVLADMLKVWPSPLKDIAETGIVEIDGDDTHDEALDALMAYQHPPKD